MLVKSFQSGFLCANRRITTYLAPYLLAFILYCEVFEIFHYMYVMCTNDCFVLDALSIAGNGHLSSISLKKHNKTNSHYSHKRKQTPTTSMHMPSRCSSFKPGEETVSASSLVTTSKEKQLVAGMVRLCQQLS